MTRMHFVKPLGVAGHDVLVHEGAYAGAEGFYFLAVAEVHDVFPLFGLGVRCLVFGTLCASAGVGCLPLRWHPRFAFVLQAVPVSVLAFAPASALCLRASRVAPVRGGTYFSLPPQRKVGKRKRLTPPTFLPA
ncbi:hypothetical protein [Paraburkholderia terrae]|uniref:hypothetical protein n=1 Tax=Paraburkholderia terrae TaxID=311230 RepID=UPI0033655995